MGSWNKTCGLSRLHIYSGTPVYVFVLEQNLHHDRCYSTAFWNPLLFPFESVYNDYGGGEYDKGISLPYIIDSLKSKLIELPVGPNQYHDIAVSKETFDINAFYESVHEGRLSIKNWSGKECPVDFVMMRKDIVDDILANWVREEYVGEGEGTTGYKSSYEKIMFKDVLDDIPPFLKEISALVDSNKFYSLSSMDFMDLDGNKVLNFMRGGHRFSNIVDIKYLLFDAMKQKDLTKATEILSLYIKGCYVNLFMDYTRNIWVPGCHEGSQGSELGAYVVAADAIKKAIEEEKERHENS